jgi:predicted MPP superfamily phosphohydrolase
VFGTILTTAVTVMHLYVFGRATTVPWLTCRVPRRAIVGAGVALWVLFLAGRGFDHGPGGSLSGMLELLGMGWMGVLFLIFVCLLAADLLTGFGLLLRPRAPSIRGWGLCAGLVLAAIAVIQGVRAPAIVRYEVPLSGLPAALDGTVLVAMADLHLGSLLGASWLEARVDQALALQPDVIALLGDTFEGHGRPEGDVLPVLRRLSAPLGAYAVLGNHDSFRRSGGAATALGEAGMRVLRNEVAEIAPGLTLVGLDERSRRAPTLDTSALADVPPGAAVVLVHRPDRVEQARAAGAGLMLAAHTHGGQVWPFGYLIRHQYPLFAGRYQLDDMVAIVCRGTGTWGPRLRLWRRGEILHVTLRSPSASP